MEDRAEQGSGLLAYLLIDAIVDDILPLAGHRQRTYGRTRRFNLRRMEAEVIEDISISRRNCCTSVVP